jgi:SAM-dependent methyltransferase
MNDKYRETFKTWNKIAQLYEEKFMDLDLYNDTYDVFCDGLSQDATSVLEIGCGPGNITRHLLERKPKLKITAIDNSENMIRLARRNNPGVDFQVMDCRDIGKIKATFGGIITGFTIPYLSAADCSALIAHCKKLLDPNGVLYLSFVEGVYENSGYISGSTGDRTYFYYYERERIEKELELNALEVTNQIQKEYSRSADSYEKHLIIMARNG